MSRLTNLGLLVQVEGLEIHFFYNFSPGRFKPANLVFLIPSESPQMYIFYHPRMQKIRKVKKSWITLDKLINLVLLAKKSTCQPTTSKFREVEKQIFLIKNSSQMTIFFNIFTYSKPKKLLLKKRDTTDGFQICIFQQKK